jgi:hypothetical protein
MLNSLNYASEHEEHLLVQITLLLDIKPLANDQYIVGEPTVILGKALLRAALRSLL